MDGTKGGYFLLILLILIFQGTSSTILAKQECTDYSMKMDDDPNEHYIDPKNPSEKYDIYSITQNNIGPSCISMNVKKQMEIKFSWKKNGDRDTDLFYNLIRASVDDSEPIDSESCEGFKSSCAANWTTPKTIPAKPGDVIQWKLVVRNTNLDGKAWIAIHSGEESPTNHPPSKPIIEPSTARINMNEPMLLSATCVDPDNDSLNYAFNWGDGKIDIATSVASRSSVSRSHSWSDPRTYEVIVGAIDESGTEYNWSEPCIVTVDSGPRPAFKNVPRLAYINEKCKFEIDSGQAIGEIEYCFDWGDGNISRTKNSITDHIWVMPGEYMVKVGIVNRNNEPIKWSASTRVLIYDKEPVYRSDNLQDKIDASNDFVELVLVDPEYIIDHEIEIANKRNLTISSKENYAVLRGERQLERLINLNKSDHIIIKQLNLRNAKVGIKLNNCSNCIIKDNIIEFGGSWCGLRLVSGNGNKIESNHMVFRQIQCANSDKAAAIKIENGKDINILNNIVEYHDASPFSYFVERTGNSLHNITICLPNNAEDMGIRYGECEAVWSYNRGIREIEDCAIEDDNDSSSVWHIA